MDQTIARFKVGSFSAVTRRIRAEGRERVEQALLEMEQELRTVICGPPFFFIEFVTDVTDGLDVRLGFPVPDDHPGSEVLEGMEVMEVTCPVSEAAANRSELYVYAADRGLISDEFTMDVYPNWNLGDRKTVSVRFIIHAWDRLMFNTLRETVCAGTAEACRKQLGAPEPEWGLQERFDWTRRVLEDIETGLSDSDLYRVVSAAAHVFPARMLDRLRVVFEEALKEGVEELDAVDRVREFMSGSAGWGEAPSREGSILISSKRPRDPVAFDAARSDVDRRKAYCFCPLIREKLEDGMPESFCLCGSGWFRQQWEAVLDRPLRVRIRESLLRGDDRCTFTIDLSERMPPPLCREQTGRMSGIDPAPGS